MFAFAGAIECSGFVHFRRSSRVGFLAQVQIYCFLMSYAASLIGEVWLLLRRQSTLARIVIVAFTSAGFLAHTAYLFTRSRTAGMPPLLSSQQDWLLVLAWIGGLLYLVLLLTHRQLAHGLFMLPAILLLVIVAIFVSREAIGLQDPLAVRRLVMFHAASLVLGIATVLGAAISALMYLLHHQRLRTRNQWLQKLALPSLENLTAANRWMVVFSIPCLTIGLVTGFVLILWPNGSDAARSIKWSDPTIVTTVIIWLAMVALLFRVLSNSYQTGKAVAQLSLLSGGFLLITVFGLMILSGSGSLTSFHSGSPASESNDGGNTPTDIKSGDAEVSQ